MDATSIDFAEGNAAPSTESSQFEVALVYQDLPTGLRARQFLNHVLDHCQLGADFTLSLWKLDLFHLPEICEQAVLSVREAALILLSLRGDIGLEPNTESWLTEWVKRRHDEECALAVLIDCDMQRLDSVAETLFRLQDLTRSSQVRLFVGFVPSYPSTQGSWKIESDHTETYVAVHGYMPHPLDSAREGGINE